MLWRSPRDIASSSAIRIFTCTPLPGRRPIAAGACWHRSRIRRRLLETQSFVLAAHLLEASGCGGRLGSREIGEHAPQGVGSSSDTVSIFRFHRFAQGKKLARKTLL